MSATQNTPPTPPADEPGWPPLPQRIWGLAGRIHVRQPWQVDPDEPDCVGLWEARDRRIAVDRRLSRHAKWQILAHEFVHSAISDAGIELEAPLEERLCDAIGSALASALEAYIEGRR